jgi:hypothetical protein
MGVSRRISERQEYQSPFKSVILKGTFRLVQLGHAPEKQSRFMQDMIVVLQADVRTTNWDARPDRLASPFTIELGNPPPIL